MTLREAHDELYGYLKGCIWSDDFEDAIRFYINKVDELMRENITLSVRLMKTQQRLRKERKLKEKYYKEIKEVHGRLLKEGA